MLLIVESGGVIIGGAPPYNPAGSNVRCQRPLPSKTTKEKIKKYVGSAKIDADSLIPRRLRSIISKITKTPKASLCGHKK
jgi:hypothetical protein